MTERKAKDIKQGFIFLILGGVLTLPYFIWHSFWFLGIGILVAVASLCYILVRSFKNYDGLENNIGCIWALFAFVFSVLCFFWNDYRYVTSQGGKQHIYIDCSTIRKSKQVKKVTECEGFFHLTFTDCKICKARKIKQIEEKEKQERERERRKLKAYLQGLIDELDNGADPNLIIDELVDDWSVEEDYEYRPGIPLKYY